MDDEPGRTKVPPSPSPDEQPPAEKVLGACMHRHWKRSIEQYAQYAICVPCGERIFLSGNWAPELSYDAISELWLKHERSD